MTTCCPSGAMYLGRTGWLVLAVTLVGSAANDAWAVGEGGTIVRRRR